MKKIFFSFCFSFVLLSAIGQTESFGITTYNAPKGWTKEVAGNYVSYTISNKQTNSWCRINILKSTISKGGIEKDFESEWEELIEKNYHPTATASLNPVQESDGWKVKAGAVNFTFNKKPAMALLTTISGFELCVSIVTTTNTQDYLNDIDALLASVEVKKPEISQQQVPVSNTDNNSIIGTWGITASDQNSWRVNNGVMSTIFRQYTFNENGTYIFIVKTFDPLMDKILLGREKGNYQIVGHTLSLNPQKSVLEAWSKKNNTDWGKLLSTQNIALEKTIYQCTKEYEATINEWRIFLQASGVTKRDGPFNSSSSPNSWIYIIASPARPMIKLPN